MSSARSARIRIMRTRSSISRSRISSRAPVTRRSSLSAKRVSTITINLVPRGPRGKGFPRHTAAAGETGLPLVIHTREADEDAARILEDEMGKGAFTAVLHCYTGGPDLARRAIELGLSISFTGILTFKKSEDLRVIAADLPAERILVETDAPYLAPGKFRGKRNEPSYVVETAKVLAEARGVSLEEISRQTTETFFRLFSKVPAPVKAA